MSQHMTKYYYHIYALNHLTRLLFCAGWFEFSVLTYVIRKKISCVDQHVLYAFLFFSLKICKIYSKT